MRVPENWLRSQVNPSISSEALAETLTMAGLEVEDLEPLAPEFSGVVVARVISCEPHPDADRLRVCRVDVGQGGEPLQIVCGAPNVAAQMLVACATEGAVLPGGFKIKRAKMRGVESQGMLCSAKELGIADDSQGLMALPDRLASSLGDDLRQALDLDAKVFTLKLTPNRADCLSIAGVAREVSALTGATRCEPKWPAVAPTIQNSIEVSIASSDLCGRFSGRVMTGVNAKAATPEWMRTRLEQAGQRPISVLVDISNYVMLELGRPNHIFDLQHVRGGLTVRWAKPHETIKLLNEQTLTLAPEIGVIADESGPIAMAGIMGGDATAVSENTENIFIEAAFWWPDAIRGKARKYNFSTDAAHRFERGVDWTTTAAHVDYITHLVQTICGGEAGPLNDQTLATPKRQPVSMRVSRCNKILGISVTTEECVSIFQRLGFETQVADERITVTPPSFRFDLEIEEDLIEEVARVHGFHNIPSRPPKASIVMASPNETHRSAMALRDRMVDQDYHEVMTYSFVSESASLAVLPEVPLKLLNPMASHQSVMRTSLWPGLIGALQTNLSRQQSRVRIFEIGRTFHEHHATEAGDWTVNGIHQPVRLAGLAFGPVFEDQWGQTSRRVDFFDVKADLEALAAPLKLTTRRSDDAPPSMHPGRSAEVLLEGEPIGWMGELHPKLIQEFDLPEAPVVFELLLEPLQILPMPRPEEVSKFPGVSRDLAFIFPVETPAGQVLSAFKKLKSQSKQGAWIKNIKCFDDYRGKGLSEKEKSLAFRFILENPEATLQDSDVDGLMASIVQYVQTEFAARLRQ